MGVADRLEAVLGLDEGGDVLHGAGAVQRHHGGDIAEGGRLELLDVAAHAGAFQLEDAGRLAGGQQLEGLGIVQRDVDAGRYRRRGSAG